MIENMNGILVLIASPGDTAEERAIVRDQINDWNINNGRRQKVVLLPWLYERNAVARMGNRPQAIINSQAVDKADVVVAFFDSRLGTATEVSVSGIAEEITRAVGMGKPVHLYFSNEPVPRGTDLTQQQSLETFRTQMESKGLYGTYEDPQDLAGQVIQALEHDIYEEKWDSPVPNENSAEPEAVLRWHHDHRKEQKGLSPKGKMEYRTLANQLVVRNEGNAPAENMTFTVQGLDGASFRLDAPKEPITIEKDSTRSWVLVPLYSGTIQIDASWSEGEQEKHGTWTTQVSR